MSTKWNLIANFGSQFYSALIGIVIVPTYVQVMGAEAYGLIGFFTLMASLFVLLDLGLTPTIVRESARFVSGSLCKHEYSNFIRSFEFVFYAMGSLIAVIVLFSSSFISRYWLDPKNIPLDDIATCIVLMGFILSCRWVSGFYRGIIIGHEKIICISAINIVFATLKFVLVIPLLHINNSPVTFFYYQLAIATIETFAIAYYARRLLPRISQKIGWSFAPIRKSLNFSLSIAFTTAVWVLVTQTDKLLLSNLMPLDMYGYFSFAVVAASGVLILNGPIGTVMMPRLAALEAGQSESGFLNIYRTGTQLAAVLGGSVAAFVFFFADSLLGVWTGDQKIVENASKIFAFYALGNGVLVLAAFPYYLQFAKGDMSMHLWGNVIFVLVLVPLIYWSAKNYGGIGAAWVWLVSNLCLFYFWLPWVHKRFLPKINKVWFSLDTTFIFGTAMLVSYGLSLIKPIGLSRFSMFLNLLLIALIIICITSIVSPFCRNHFKKIIGF